jgi:hypothetical protein
VTLTAAPLQVSKRDLRYTYSTVAPARDARLRAKLCTMTLLRHAHNPMVAVFRISRASRRKRRSCQESRFVTTAYPSRGREHEREIPHHRKFNLDAWNKMVQKKIVAISFEEGVVFRVEDQLFKIASSCHNAWTGCNIMILKHFPLSPTPLSSLLSRTCRGTDKLGTPTCHHP